MNRYFYEIFVPYTLMALGGIVVCVLQPHLLFWLLGFWLVLGVLGTGVGLHRLFTHRQFQTFKPIEYLLAVIGTLTASGPIIFWVGSHLMHHRHVDTDKDPSTPLHGRIHAVLTWNLKKGIEEKMLLKHPAVMLMLRDERIVWLSQHFNLVNYLFITFLLGLNWRLALVYALAATLERFRIGLNNWLQHSPHVPGARAPHSNQNAGNSQNNLLLLPFLWGFTWHNNHHVFPNSERHPAVAKWWQFDPEALVIWFIRRRSRV